MRELNTIPSEEIETIWFHQGHRFLRVLYRNGGGIVEFEPVTPVQASALEDERTSLEQALRLLSESDTIRKR